MNELVYLDGYDTSSSANDVWLQVYDYQSGQTQATTPTIDHVDLPPGSIVAAEGSQAAGQQTINVTIQSLPASTVVDKVEAIVLHNTAGVTLPPIQLSVTSNPLVHTGVFAPPAGWMGWGYYSVNVQVVAKNTQTNAKFYSDWWPRLRGH